MTWESDQNVKINLLQMHPQSVSSLANLDDLLTELAPKVFFSNKRSNK